MLAKTFGGAVYGVDAKLITIEVNVSQGTKFWMSGLPDSAVKESEHRVDSAIKYYGYNMPRQKVVVNLAPADIKKEGSAYDLPIALNILKASNQIKADTLEEYVIMGELSLDGKLRPIKGALPIAIEARKNEFKGFILPKENANEAAIVNCELQKKMQNNKRRCEIWTYNLKACQFQKVILRQNIQLYCQN